MPEGNSFGHLMAQPQQQQSAPRPQGGFIPAPGAAEQQNRLDNIDARAANNDARNAAYREQDLALRQRAEAREEYKFQMDQDKLAQRLQTEQTAITDSTAQMRRVIEAATKAKTLSRDGWFTTGFGAETARGIAGTKARDVQALLNTIGSNTAFDRLQRMRAESPTGAALGSVSEIELQLLRDSIASLDQSQSDEQFQQNMDTVIDAYQTVLDRLEGNPTPDGLDRTRRPEMFGDVPVGTNVRTGFQGGADEGRSFDRSQVLLDRYGLTPNQEATIVGFWNVNRGNADLTAEGVRAFFADNGLPIPGDRAIQVNIENAQKEGFLFGPLDLSEEEAAARERVSAFAEDMGEYGYLDLARQGVSLGLLDEAAGVGTALGGLIGGDTDIAKNYTLGRDVEAMRLEEARERLGYGGTAAELLGGGAIGKVQSGLQTALGAGRQVAARGGDVTRAAIQSQLARRAATEGAAAGGIAGFGYGEGAEESLTGAALGAGLGGAIGYGLQRTGNALANRRGGGSGGGGAPPAAPTTPGGQVVQAADNFNAATGANIQPLPADTGGPLIRRASGAVAQTTFGAKPIVEAAEAANSQAQTGIRALAARQGAVPTSKQAGGEVAIKGADKAIKRSRLKVDALYSKARKEAGDAQVPLPLTRTVLQDHIDELSRAPFSADGLSTLRSLADDIGDRTFPVDGIKSMRAQLRDKFIKEGLRGSDIERRVNDVIDAADLDIEDGLIALGKGDAAKSYAEASKAASERFTMIDDVLAPIIGKKGEKSGEQVFEAIDRMTRGDSVALGQFIRAVPEEEAGSIRGIVIDRLGRASKGRQDADGQAFSLNDFLTRWNDEGLSREAKSVLFDGETIAALDDLARVAQGTKEGQRFANFSNTGGANFLNFFLNGAPLGAAATGVGPAVLAGGASVASQVGLGRLLASPGFARWLAKMPKQATPGAASAHINGLTKVAKANPALSSDILSIQSRLQASIAASGGQGSVSIQSGAVQAVAQEPALDSNTTEQGTR